MTYLLIEIRLLGGRSILFIVLGLLVSCSSNRHLKSNEGVIIGKVRFEKGNQMPGPNSSISGKGVIRDIYIYELTNEKNAVLHNSLYTQVDSKLINIIKSDSNGDFEVNIKEGVYSILIKEEKGFFVSILDKDNNLHPVRVKNGEKTIINILINYKAYY